MENSKKETLKTNPVNRELIESKIKSISNLFDILVVANLGIIMSFATYLLFSSTRLFDSFVYNMFAKIPYIGQMLHLGIKSLNIVDLTMIQTKLLNPLLILEIIYYTFPLIVVQMVLYALKRNVVKRENAYFSLVCIFMIVSAIVIVKQFDLVLIPTAQQGIIGTRDMFVNLMFLIQLVAVGYVVTQMSKVGRFNFDGLNRHEFAHRVMKVGAITSLVLLGTIGTGLTVINTQANHLKNQIQVDYVLDLKPAADGTVNIVLPKALIETSQRVGVNLPETIKGGQILEEFFVSEIDFGTMVTDFLTTTIDGLVYQHIGVPLMNAMVVVMLLILSYFMYYLVGKVPFSPVVMYLSQSAILVVLNVGFASKFGVLVSIFTGLMLIGSVIHVVTAIQESGYTFRIKKVKDLVGKQD